MFDDFQGQRTGFNGLYTAITGGMQYRPVKDILIRPEVRFDYNGYSLPFENKHGIFTAAIDAIVRFLAAAGPPGVGPRRGNGLSRSDWVRDPWAGDPGPHTEVIRMSRTTRLMLGCGLAAVGALAPLAVGQDKKETVPPGTPVTITVTTAAAAPDVSISLDKREGHVTPNRSGCNHTGGGNIDVQQPSPDTLVVTMAGAAVAHGGPRMPASAALDFLLTQGFEVSIDNPKIKNVKLSMEARVVGFLRCSGTGSAEQSGSVGIGSASGQVLTVAVPPHSVSGCTSLGVNDKEGPVSASGIAAGKYCLTQQFHVGASMPKVFFPCKSPSAEFAPDPALNPPLDQRQGAVRRGQQEGPRVPGGRSRWRPTRRSKSRRSSPPGGVS